MKNEIYIFFIHWIVFSLKPNYNDPHLINWALMALKALYQQIRIRFSYPV